MHGSSVNPIKPPASLPSNCNVTSGVAPQEENFQISISSMLRPQAKKKKKKLRRLNSISGIKTETIATPLEPIAEAKKPAVNTEMLESNKTSSVQSPSIPVVSATKRHVPKVYYI